MVEMSCEEHDQHAAESQFITHTVARILSHMNLESTPIDTKGYEALLELVNYMTSELYMLTIARVRFFHVWCRHKARPATALIFMRASLCTM